MRAHGTAIIAPLCCVQRKRAKFGHALTMSKNTLRSHTNNKESVLSGIKTLVVDDDPDVLSITRLMLTEHHAEVIAASTASEGMPGKKAPSSNPSSIPGSGSAGQSPGMGTNPSTVPGTRGTGSSSGSGRY